MRQPSKIRNIARWTGTILCIVLGLAWIFSLIMTVLWRRPTSPTPVPSATVPGHLLYPGRFCQLMYGVVQTGNSYSPTNAGGWDLFRGSAMPGWVLRRYNWGFVPPRFIPGGVLIPLWLPLLVVGVPVAWSWYTALWRYPPGIRVL
ncbi:MAG TPA: hypothetical protein VMV94_01095, partial [Phycisphaerae bacterium]|nr:hypothetical protein [Phycisphaerae bacterium]